MVRMVVFIFYLSRSQITIRWMTIGMLGRKGYREINGGPELL